MRSRHHVYGDEGTKKIAPSPGEIIPDSSHCSLRETTYSIISNFFPLSNQTLFGAYYFNLRCN